LLIRLLWRAASLKDESDIVVWVGCLPDRYRQGV
jgi:hypothetical protein